MTDFGKTQKVVIVEDNTALNDIYKTRLELLGYTVFSAYDGLQALQVIEREMPDLVLLDLMVPKKAGDQVLEEMRESEWGRHIKVAIISNLNEADAPIGLRNLGIEAYAVKANLSNDQLDQLVDTILKPAGQAEDVLLSGQSHEVVSTAPHDPGAIPAPQSTENRAREQASSIEPEPQAAEFAEPLETEDTAPQRPAEVSEAEPAQEAEPSELAETSVPDAAAESDDQEETPAEQPLPDTELPSQDAAETEPAESVWPTDAPGDKPAAASDEADTASDDESDEPRPEEMAL